MLRIPCPETISGQPGDVPTTYYIMLIPFCLASNRVFTKRLCFFPDAPDAILLNIGLLFLPYIGYNPNETPRRRT